MDAANSSIHKSVPPWSEIVNNLIDNELSQFSSIIFQVSLGLLPHSHIGQTLQPLNNLIAHKVGPSFLLFFTFFPFSILKLTLSRYFVDDLSDLIDCMDYGFHQSLSRAMMMRSDALKQVANKIKMSVSYHASFPDSKVRAAGYWSHGEGVGCFGLQVADLTVKSLKRCNAVKV